MTIAGYKLVFNSLIFLKLSIPEYNHTIIEY